TPAASCSGTTPPASTRACDAMPTITGLGHVGLYCNDLPKMRRFYAETLGLTISDEDRQRGICFLSAVPDSEHHELALVQAKDPEQKTRNVQQVSFKVRDLDSVREFYHRLRAAGMEMHRAGSQRIARSEAVRRPRGH